MLDSADYVPQSLVADTAFGWQDDQRPWYGYSAAVRAGRPGGQVAEFKAMVDALHRAGLEVVLDVVFNHTAELRYWLTEMHADGFRFGPAPARQEGGNSKAAAFLDMVAQDPGGPGPSWSPSRGTSTRWTATTWAASRRCGGSGTASTATPCDF